ncbi:MAG: ATP synthase F1 subunit epsilon [Blastocatellia bacterium]|jgi:F-type H+-transporting ATPase subunit epsilon|nr:ATP synthase F1 subunit epsilon [Blastocatellia bacterium]
MLKLEIVTPERKVVDAEVDSVSVPTASGEAGILPGHAPLISALKPGILSYSAKGTSEKLAISGGFVEVNGSNVSVLATTAAAAADINLDEAKAEREAAEKALASVASSAIEDTETYREALDAANAKIMIAGGR